MPARILAIDESTDILALYHDILSDAGYEVHLCAEGDAALDTIHALGPDIIILDGHMIGSHTESTLVDLLLQDTGVPRARLLLCSGDGPFLEERRSVFDALGGAVLRKPFHIDDLLVLVARLSVPLQGDRRPTRS